MFTYLWHLSIPPSHLVIIRFFRTILVDRYRTQHGCNRHDKKRAVSHFLYHDSFDRRCYIKPMQRQMWKSQMIHLPLSFLSIGFHPALSSPAISFSFSITSLLSVHLPKHQSVGDIRGLMWEDANADIHSFMHGWNHSSMNAEQGTRVYPSFWATKQVPHTVYNIQLLFLAICSWFVVDSQPAIFVTLHEWIESCAL